MPMLHRWDCRCGTPNAPALPVCRRCGAPQRAGPPVYGGAAPVPRRASRALTRWTVALCVLALVLGALYRASAGVRTLAMPRPPADPYAGLVRVVWTMRGADFLCGRLENHTGETLQRVRVLVRYTVVEARSGFLTGARTETAHARVAALQPGQTVDRLLVPLVLGPIEGVSVTGCPPRQGWEERPLPFVSEVEPL